MARYIDADGFRKHLELAMEKMQFIRGVKAVDVWEVIKSLDNQPTADVAEVPCRCEKCKYRKTHTCAITGTVTLFCDYGEKPVVVEPTHYCGYGERKDVTDINVGNKKE